MNLRCSADVNLDIDRLKIKLGTDITLVNDSAPVTDSHEDKRKGFKDFSPQYSDTEVNPVLKSTRQQILEEAIQCVTKDRNATHGDPEDNFKMIASLWNNYLSMRRPNNETRGLAFAIVDAMDVSVMMVLMKISRIISSPQCRDHWTDICGYAACGGEIALKLK